MRRPRVRSRERHRQHEDRHDLYVAVSLLQEGKLRFDRMLDTLHLVVHAVRILGQ
ncbi:MAG TPA: hypothetical protein VKV24_02720 [Casimicrobiaceae bacterium]|nr:hypothetical protein [Casimicrobiaceae bacterium]